MTKFNENNIIFANNFLEFVYFNILSELSRDIFFDKINNIPYVNNIQTNIQKVFIKRHPQQVIVFVRFNEVNCLIEAFKFGLTDILTGKRSHVKTVEKILLEKSSEEMEYLY
ncbi:hypothetical protein FW755_09380 [Lonepinella koalarum]|uniref:hypothetical protein n=1 Tax=Lonepinella koalarum TaxID=53417 RepID=UPI0011E3DABA|nr:hypothetical protein [Lonepinella koalarum]TYG35288.1 hypothetical protein FW755_09380 [Lonepinella koalarum]